MLICYVTKNLRRSCNLRCEKKFAESDLLVVSDGLLAIFSTNAEYHFVPVNNNNNNTNAFHFTFYRNKSQMATGTIVATR